MNKLILRILFVAGALTVTSSLSHAEVVIVVNNSVAVSSITVDVAANIFLGKVDELPGGIRMVPIDQEDGQKARTEFYSKVVKKDAMRIDIGAKNKDAAAAKVKIGNYAAFVTPYEENGAPGGRTAIGKAFDNRAGCAALIELLRGDPYPFDLVAAFTVQEEVGLRGAKIAAYSVKPDVALVLESTPAYDLPNDKDISPNVALGRGPSIYVMDARTIQDPRLVAHLTRTADARGIPYQIRQPGGGGTNSGAIQRAAAGIPVATLAVPGRYAHTPTMMISLDDYENVVRLADAALRELPADIVRR